MKYPALFVFAASLLAAPVVFAQSAQSAASTGSRRDIVSYVEELAGNTAAQLRAVQDENAELETRVIELERKIAALQDSNQKLLNEVAAVKRQSAADAATHEKQMKTIISMIENLAATPAPTPVAAPASTTTEYVIYEVEKGATLSVIAKAYSEAFGKTVTVQEIKKANNLKSDTLQIGQKLKIPKK